MLCDIFPAPSSTEITADWTKERRDHNVTQADTETPATTTSHYQPLPANTSHCLTLSSAWVASSQPPASHHWLGGTARLNLQYISDNQTTKLSHPLNTAQLESTQHFSENKMLKIQFSTFSELN